MSAPEFERVLGEHCRKAFQQCSCGSWPDSHRAHLAAALNAEVARWLADQGTRERVEREMFRHATNASNLPRWIQEIGRAHV